MREFWSHCMERAEHLVAGGGPSAGMLEFYIRILTIQKQVHSAFAGADAPSGDLSADCIRLRPHLHTLLRVVRDHGPGPLAREAADLAGTNESERDRALIDFWRNRSDRQFFPKTLLQPWAHVLASAGKLRRPAASDDETRCPRCGGRAQLSILQRADQALADGGGRTLLCANCLSEWPYNRIRCAHCGESDEKALGYFRADDYDHLRLDTCDTCRHYGKSIDLTRLGLAAPLVDEAASTSLDLWARDHGYAKIELNLLGI